MRLLLVFLIVVVGSAIGVQATTLQKPIPAKPALVKKSIILKKDTGNVELRKFDEEAIKTYKKQKEFIYDDVAPESLSWWGRFWQWFWHLIGRILSNNTSGSIIKYVLIGLVIVIIAFVVIKLIGLDYKWLTGKSKSLEVPYNESLENIHEINFDSDIEKALQNGNYRLVVRLLYLKTLKQLSDKQLIHWLPEKTNQAYVLELKDASYKEDFTQLTYQFEYIWYGEFFIDKNTFEPIYTSFQQFNQKTA